MNSLKLEQKEEPIVRIELTEKEVEALWDIHNSSDDKLRKFVERDKSNKSTIVKVSSQFWHELNEALK